MTEFTILPEQYDAVVREAEGRLPDIADKERAVVEAMEALRDAMQHHALKAAVERVGRDGLELRMEAMHESARQCIAGADAARAEYIRADDVMAARADEQPRGAR